MRSVLAPLLALCAVSLATPAGAAEQRVPAAVKLNEVERGFWVGSSIGAVFYPSLPGDGEGSGSGAQVQMRAVDAVLVVEVEERPAHRAAREDALEVAARALRVGVDGRDALVFCGGADGLAPDQRADLQVAGEVVAELDPDEDAAARALSLIHI